MNVSKKTRNDFKCNIGNDQIETTADTIGAIAGGVTVAGIAAHAIATNIRKRDEIEGKKKSSKKITDSTPADSQDGGE